MIREQRKGVPKYAFDNNSTCQTQVWLYISFMINRIYGFLRWKIVWHLKKEAKDRDRERIDGSIVKTCAWQTTWERHNKVEIIKVLTTKSTELPYFVLIVPYFKTLIIFLAFMNLHTFSINHFLSFCKAFLYTNSVTKWTSPSDT